MALTQITYNDKSNYQSSSLANEYKVSASDMNEIKGVVNGACTQVDTNTSDIATLNAGTVYDYSLTAKTGSFSAGSWQTLCDDFTTDSIPAGKYLLIGSISMGAAANGLTSVDLVLDSARIGTNSRITIPLASGLLMTANTCYVVTFNSASTHKLNFDSYANVQINNVSSPHYFIVKI